MVTRNLSIWMSWSWNESGDVYGRVIWSENGGVLGTASLGSGTCEGKKNLNKRGFCVAKPKRGLLITNQSNLLLIRGGLRRHMGGGGGILRGGESLRGGGRTRCVSTADAVISCPSIWPLKLKKTQQSYLTHKCRILVKRQKRKKHSGLPPSIYLRAFWASSGVSNST